MPLLPPYINSDHEYALLPLLGWIDPLSRSSLGCDSDSLLGLHQVSFLWTLAPGKSLAVKRVIINIRWILDAILCLTDGDPQLSALRLPCPLAILEASYSRLVGIPMPWFSVSASLPFLVIHVAKIPTYLKSQSAFFFY